MQPLELSLLKAAQNGKSLAPNEHGHISIVTPLGFDLIFNYNFT